MEAKCEDGNVLFLILIAVALFAALSYAVTSSSRGGSGDTSKEQQKIDQAVIDGYAAEISSGVMILEIARGCTTINYDPPSAWGVEDKGCHMFHADGAGIIYRDLGLDECLAKEGKDKSELNIGESCGGLVYAGISGGNRIYTTLSDLTSLSWNNGSSNRPATGVTGASDGLSNTNTLLGLSDLGAPYDAAAACRAFGEDWYLPALDELDLLQQNKNVGALDGTFDEGSVGWYWASSESTTTTHGRVRRMSDGSVNHGSKSYTGYFTRCVRRD